MSNPTESVPPAQSTEHAIRAQSPHRIPLDALTMTVVENSTGAPVFIAPKPSLVALADRAARDAVQVQRRPVRRVEPDDDEPNPCEYAREREGNARG